GRRGESTGVGHHPRRRGGPHFGRPGTTGQIRSPDRHLCAPGPKAGTAAFRHHFEPSAVMPTSIGAPLRQTVPHLATSQSDGRVYLERYSVGILLDPARIYLPPLGGSGERDLSRPPGRVTAITYH